MFKDAFAHKQEKTPFHMPDAEAAHTRLQLAILDAQGRACLQGIQNRFTIAIGVQHVWPFRSGVCSFSSNAVISTV